MKIKFFLFFVLTILLVSSCSTHEEYPKNWQQIQHSATTDCIDISGKYENIGESTTPGYKPELAWKLFPDNNVLNKKATHISFTVKQSDILSITLWENDEQIYTRDLLKGKKGFYCEDGLIKIKVTENTNRDGVLGTEWSILGFTKTDNILVVKNENGAVGMMFLIPVAGTGTDWYRFKQSE